MVRLGIIGLGTTWEGPYLSALKNLRSRVCVQAVFDAVFARARQTARTLGAAAETSLLALARRCDVDALLLLDSGWYGAEALRLLCAEGKPVYIAADVGHDPAVLQALHWTAVNFGLTLMPEFPLRYTPATARLQELMATRLGEPHHVRGELFTEIPLEELWAAPDETAVRLLLNWFDWTRYVLRAMPRNITVESPPAWQRSAESALTKSPAAERRLVKIEFHSLRNGVVPAACFQCTFSPAVVKAGSNPPAFCSPGRQEVTCANGTAVIESSTVLCWQTEGESAREQLSADRNETEVQLDHFCRRVVGGLIPVADLSDVSRGLALIHAARESWQSGCPVSLNGRL